MDVTRELPRIRGGHIAAALCGGNTSVRSAHDSAGHFVPHAADPRACWKLSAHVSTRRRSGRARRWRDGYHLYTLDTFGLSVGGCWSRIERASLVSALPGGRS